MIDRLDITASADRSTARSPYQGRRRGCCGEDRGRRRQIALSVSCRRTNWVAFSAVNPSIEVSPFGLLPPAGHSHGICPKRRSGKWGPQGQGRHFLSPMAATGLSCPSYASRMRRVGRAVEPDPGCVEQGLFIAGRTVRRGGPWNSRIERRYAGNRGNE